MTKTFYTNVQTYGSKILYRGVENGRKVRGRVGYNPTLFVSSNKPTKYTTIYGEYVDKIEPGSIRDCRDFVDKYSEVENFKVYGMLISIQMMLNGIKTISTSVILTSR